MSVKVSILHLCPQLHQFLLLSLDTYLNTYPILNLPTYLSMYAIYSSTYIRYQPTNSTPDFDIHPHTSPCLDLPFHSS